jgi:dihydroorotate dehydrogenase
MLGAVFGLVRPLLFALHPERAHELTLKSLQTGLHPRSRTSDDPRLAVELWGLRFPNPLGTAAGFDKDGRVPDAVLAMGFGHAEVGTVTPMPQAGNPRPRVFRLVADRALINRLGFNNAGQAAALERLKRRPHRGIVGVNVGANKDAPDRTADYVAGVSAFYDVASYFTLNISSPNTPGLRDLQAPTALDELLSRVLAAREALMAEGKPRRPIMVKIAPDIAEDDLAPMVQVMVARGVDGIAVSNSTLARHGLSNEALAGEAGGVSGRPLFHRSTVVLARVHLLTGGRVPLVGIGGIDCTNRAIAKIEAGASLLQLYTGLVFEGPGLVTRIRREMLAHVERQRLPSITAAVGRRAAEWAGRPLEM